LKVTAFSNFWEQMATKKPQLCSLCDPEIRHWHGHFDRQSAAEYARVHGKSAIAWPAQAQTKKEGNDSDVMECKRDR
jgi:hypothetical protein